MRFCGFDIPERLFHWVVKVCGLEAGMIWLLEELDEIMEEVAA